MNKFCLFSRYFFSQRFGGSAVDTFPKIGSAKLAEHQLNDWAFPSVEFNPHAPQIPGAPGLFYQESDHERQELIRRKRVIVRLDVSKWLYVGTYDFIPAARLTAEEYTRHLPEKVVFSIARAPVTASLICCFQVKKRWADAIRELREWGLAVLARVYHRLHNGGEEPSNEELQSLKMTENVHKLKSVTNDQLIQAYTRGEEVSAWRLHRKCHLY